MVLVSIGIILICTSLLSSCVSNNEPLQNKDKSNTKQITDPVHICNSVFATKFHLDRQCKGLENCNRNIRTIDKSEADSLGYVLCAYEHR